MADLEADVAIVGGGVAGLSAGAFLADAAQVVLLEAEEALGYHASGRSAALYEESYGKPEVNELARASRPVFDELGVLSPRGFMMIVPRGEEERHAEEAADPRLEEIGLDEALAWVPILRREAIGRVLVHRGAMDIDTDRLLQSYARRLRQGGGTILTRAPVEAIARAGGRWELRTPQGTVTAPVVIDAAGAWADRVAALAGLEPLGITPYRRSIARTPAPGGHDVSGWPMLFGAGESWYAKPDAGAWLISPAEEDPVEPHDAWADDMVLAEGIDRYQAFVTEEVTRVLTSWAGLRSFAPDRLLVLGADPAAPGFFWSAGQGGYGMQTSAAAGRLVADLVAGRPPALPPDLVAAFDPARLRR